MQTSNASSHVLCNTEYFLVTLARVSAQTVHHVGQRTCIPGKPFLKVCLSDYKNVIMSKRGSYKFCNLMSGIQCIL